ncbi:MAG: putative rane protein [Dehalococcoidia bacterium]|nr:putative rane protein [Dehalococcoidia bacterium]
MKAAILNVMGYAGLVARGLIRHLRNSLIRGLLILVPVAITYWILRLVFNLLDGLLQPAFEGMFNRTIPGAGLVLLLLLLYFLGNIGANVLGRTAIRWSQNLLLGIPMINFVYSGAKELIESFSGLRTTGFKRVVVIEYPRLGTWTIGFLTGTARDETGALLGIVYIPTAPTPQSGWVTILPLEQIYDCSLSVPTALRFVLSGGIVTPPLIRKQRLVT